MTRTIDGDEGFTLIELMIAMLIMAVAVVVLVTAMSTVIVATSQHRGQAGEETVARNYAEAIQQKASSLTTRCLGTSDLTPASLGVTLPTPAPTVSTSFQYLSAHWNGSTFDTASVGNQSACTTLLTGGSSVLERITVTLTTTDKYQAVTSTQVLVRQDNS